MRCLATAQRAGRLEAISWKWWVAALPSRCASPGFCLSSRNGTEQLSPARLIACYGHPLSRLRSHPRAHFPARSGPSPAAAQHEAISRAISRGRSLARTKWNNLVIIARSKDATDAASASFSKKLRSLFGTQRVGTAVLDHHSPDNACVFARVLRCATPAVMLIATGTHHAAIMPLAPLCNQVQPRAVAHSSAAPDAEARCVLLSHEIYMRWSAQDWSLDTSRYACRHCVTRD